SFGEGVRVPGAESRWSAGKNLDWTPVRPGVVVEVSYDQLEGNRFRHATRFHRWRPDKDPRECTMDQLELPEGPGFSDVVRAGSCPRGCRRDVAHWRAVQPVVAARGLTHDYGPVVALRDVDVEIPPGVTGLVGANGAGKT